MFGKLFTREPSDPRIRFIDSEVYRKMCQKFGKYQLVNGSITGLLPVGEAAYALYPPTDYTRPLFTSLLNRLTY